MEFTVESAVEACSELGKEKRIRILHVDDDADFLTVAKQCLEEQSQFQVDTALSSEEALEKLKNTEYAAIIADFEMPGKNGLELLKQLRKEKNNIPFILFTCKGKEEIAIEALNLGVDHYIGKQGKPEIVYDELKRNICLAVRKRTSEQLLQESEEKYRKLFEEALDAIFIADPETGIIIDCNRAATALIGKTKSELIGTHQRFLHPPTENEEKFTKTFEQHRNVKEGLVIETQVITKNGEIRDAAIKSNMIDINGQIMMQGIFRDITESKKSLEKVRSQARLLDAVGQAIVAADGNGKITYWHGAAEQPCGWSASEMLGRSFVGLLNDVVQEQDLEVFNYLRSGKCWVGEAVLKRRDGMVLIVIMTVAPVTNAKGDFMGAIGVSTDITEQRWMQEALKQAIEEVAGLNEKLRVVESLTRHDIRNKLSALNGRVYLLRKRCEGNPEALLQLSEIERVSQQMLRIMEFERIYVLVGAEELKCVNVETCVNEASSLFSDLKGAKLINDCCGLTVLADSLLRQLFYNLIDNTLKYGEKTSTIRVHYEEDAEGLKLIYEDDGIGIADEEKGHLFQEGYGQGTGYGLYLIKRICEAYGWAVQETGKHGQNARFTLKIPKNGKDDKKGYTVG